MGLIDLVKGKRIYLDSCVFIYALEGIAEWRGPVHTLFQAIDNRQCDSITSELTLAECLIMPLRRGNPILANQYKKAIQPRAGLVVLPVNRTVLMEMAALRAGNQALRTPDAIHLASAAIARCDLYLTNDKRLQSVGTEIVQLSEWRSLEG